MTIRRTRRLSSITNTGIMRKPAGGGGGRGEATKIVATGSSTAPFGGVGTTKKIMRHEGRGRKARERPQCELRLDNATFATSVVAGFGDQAIPVVANDRNRGMVSRRRERTL